MKRLLLCLVLLVPISVSAEDFPARKSGLWSIETSMSGMPGGRKMEQCVDKATDAAMMKMGQGMSEKMGASCSKQELRKEGSRYITESECAMNGGMRMVSKGVFTGDFTSQYRGEISAKYDPPMMGMSESKTTITAKWVGPCKEGQKPGDIVMANGMKMNMADLEKLGSGLKPR